MELGTMARRMVSLNKYQRAARKPGEARVGREEIQQLLEWSLSNNAAECVLAAQFLCPCHVRRRIDAVLWLFDPALALWVLQIGVIAFQSNDSVQTLRILIPLDSSITSNRPDGRISS
jgi:hypothetical protein